MFYFVLLYYFNIMQLSVYKPSGQEIRRYGISLGMRDGRNRKKKSFVSFMQANAGLGSVMYPLCNRGRLNAICVE